jgi:DNA-binding CsgD family transcriptional regulator
MIEPLTNRQQEVLVLLSYGRSTKEISQTLWITRTTVRNHIQEIMRKLDVHTRLAAVMTMQGLLPPAVYSVHHSYAPVVLGGLAKLTIYFHDPHVTITIS